MQIENRLLMSIVKKDIRQLISRLEKKEICIHDIPQEYRDLSDIITTERKLGLRRITRCGYDVICNLFFIEEDVFDRDEENDWSQLEPQYFKEFDSYYKYLDGNIYENACYYQLDPKKIPGGIDLERLYKKKSFIESTIDEYNLTFTQDEQADYLAGEKKKGLIKRWMDKFNKCSSYKELKRTVENYNKSTLHNTVDVSFFFWNYIFTDIESKDRFQSVMEYVSADIYPSLIICNALCAIYDPDDVVDNYKYSLGSYQTCRKHIRALKRIANKVKNDEYDYYEKGYFDINTHFFCVETKCYERDFEWPSFIYKEYFENIAEFVERLEGDLSSCDLSKSAAIDFDFSKCKIDDTTKLPIDSNGMYDYSVKKTYCDSLFRVTQIWTNNRNIIVKRYDHVFDLFCDFVAFLKGDLTNADLASCDGLDHVVPTDQINLKNALITSHICEKWGLEYIQLKVDAPFSESFDFSEKNEAESSLLLLSSRGVFEKNDTTGLVSTEEPNDSLTERIYYISDIHLNHLLKNKNVKNKADIIKIVRDVVSTIVHEGDDIILIDGDISSDYALLRLFVSELGSYHRTVVFTIGNHDMWGCPDDTIDQISDKLRTLLKENGMYLLQNDVLYFTEYYLQPVRISEHEINNLTVEELRNRVKCARLILFGGTGFSGYNQLYNAEIGLYQENHTIGKSREIEFKETQRFEGLYKKICLAFNGKNVVIMTHMPLPDWHKPAWQFRDSDYSKDMCGEIKYRMYPPEDNIGTYSAYHPGFVYVSGHTHRNYYYDDGEIRIYADNQFGYNRNNPSARPHLKYFEIETAIDFFSDYDDGIYEITTDEYRQFYRGKNIMMNFTREDRAVIMLKKNGYYCFISRAKNKCLSIMNGGALRRLKGKDINYYYENMDSVITLIKNPLNKYTTYQMKISEEIKKLGGDGSIHGCIVDIDYYSHVYVNPIDGTITGYWASDIINKLVYPTVPALLEVHCPRLFTAYERTKETKKNLPIISGGIESQLAFVPVVHLDTDIYRASRQIKKMQKLYSNILTTWPDILPDRRIVEEDLLVSEDEG